MTRIMLVVVALLVASFALAEKSAEPVVPVEEVAVAAQTSVTVQNGIITYGSIRVPVQKVLHPRVLTGDEDKAVRKYMADHEYDLRKSGNYEATEASIRLLFGIEQAHLPLAWRPKDYMSSAQIVWQMLKYLDLYANVPLQPQDSHVLGPCPAPQYRQPVTWQAMSNDAPCKTSEVRPTYVAAYAPLVYRTAGNGPMGGENKVSIQRIVPDLTMLAYAWVASRWFRCSCGKAHAPGQCQEGGQPIDGPGGGDLINTGPPVPPVPGQRN